MMEVEMHELDKMSIEELAGLRDRTIAVLADKVELRQRELEEEIARINELNGRRPLGDLFGNGKKPAVRYRGPNGEEWSGRGAKPKWVEDQLGKGLTLDQLKAA
jgi:DNA-binding protein H-NS